MYYNRFFMDNPFLFCDTPQADNEWLLDEDTSRHVATVLRMQAGEYIHLTNGNGQLLNGELLNAHKKHCGVRITSVRQVPAPERSCGIAISLLKNATRFE